MIANPALEPAACAHIPGTVLFAVFQNGARANGGIESITQIIEGLEGTPRLVLTNAETPATARWRDASAQTVVWPLPYVLGRSWRAGGLIPLLRRLVSLLATNWWTWRVVRARGVQAVHCNDPAPFWHVAWGARLAGVPLILNLRDTKPEGELKIGRYRRKFNLCQRVLVLSQEMRDFYEPAVQVRRGRKSPPIDYIYSVVDFTRMRPLAPADRLRLRRELGINDKTFAIGFIATFNEKKNQLEFLRQAASRMRERCASAQTFFVGDFEPEVNAYARACQETARAAGLEGGCAHFVGFCEMVEKWYQSCDVIVVPTRNEGMARCMIEGLACGTPVVSFDVSSAREILEEYQCGRVVRQGNYEQLCREMIALAACPETRREYGENAVIAARKLFSAETSLRRYRGLLLDCADR